MVESDIYKALSEIFADLFMRDDIVLKPDTTAQDIDGWDSFKQIDIVMACEERFALKFQTREIDSLKNVGDLVAVISSKVDGKAL